MTVSFVYIPKELYERISWILMRFFHSAAPVDESNAIDDFINLGDAWVNDYTECIR